jgi:hypothetical protein
LDPVVSTLGDSLDAALNETMLPDDVHDVRKLSLKFRNLLDIFSPVYPSTAWPRLPGVGKSAAAIDESTNNSKKNEKRKNDADVWDQIRGQIDDGYTVMGDFQDLAHSKVNYTPPDLRQRLDAVLKWHAEWKLYNYTQNYTGYVRFAPFDSTKPSKHHGDSKYFWHNEKAKRPSTTTGSGIEVVRSLVRTQLANIGEASKVILSLPSILSDSAHDQFHGFRKACRAVNDDLFSVGGVPIFNLNDTGVGGALSMLEDLYDKYGDLNDEWNKYDYYKKKKDKSAEDAAAAGVNSTWEALREFQQDQNLPTLLQQLSEGLTTECA